jgi:hypothetical protein
MYAKGTDNGVTKPTGTLVQIVGKELRKIGDWGTYAIAPLDLLMDDDKHFVGWYWYNTNKETRYWMEDETVLALKGENAELFEQLLRIYNEDRNFFERIADKMKIGVWMFEDEIKRREDVANHTPHDVKYVIYDTDTNGHGWTVNVGEPIGTVKVRTTGDDRADQVTAIKRHLAAKTGEPEDKVNGIGYYNAVVFGEYEATRDDHIQTLRNKLDAALEAAVWEG